jgi:hypothetical protein
VSPLRLLPSPYPPPRLDPDEIRERVTLQQQQHQIDERLTRLIAEWQGSERRSGRERRRHTERRSPR